VFQEIDPDHFQLLGKVPTGAISKTGLWVPELKRFYSAVPRHYVFTGAPRNSRPAGRPSEGIEHRPGRDSARKGRRLADSMLSDLVIEEAHLMVLITRRKQYLKHRHK